MSTAYQRTLASWLVAALLAVMAGGFYVSASSGHAQSAGEPELLLPWKHGQSWITGSAGFHASNDALDFFPPDTPFSTSIRCEGDPDWVFEESSYWVLASAAGVVTHVGDAYVLLDHGDGWFTRYYHVSAYQVTPGSYVQQGQRLGHPSTLGECSSGPHVHFWATGPGGATTRNVSLSGIPATEYTTNTYYSQTFNTEPGNPAPTPTVASTPTVTIAPTHEPSTTPTPTPTPTPSPSPSPTPVVYALGDANCDQLVDARDAGVILLFAAGTNESKCAGGNGDVDCDGVVTSLDALAVLASTVGKAELPEACTSPTAAPPETPLPTDDPGTPPAAPTQPAPTHAPLGQAG